MNPNSNYYRAINTGFPNAYDRANDRHGAFLMIHGDCSSRGCYAMTDEQVGEPGTPSHESSLGLLEDAQDRQRPFRANTAFRRQECRRQDLNHRHRPTIIRSRVDCLACLDGSRHHGRKSPRPIRLHWSAERVRRPRDRFWRQK
jgi:hypothetical protein